MKEILKITSAVSDQAEVYYNSQESDSVSFENAQLKDIDSKIQSGLSLRLIKDNKLGFAYTKNLLSPEDLVNNALSSLKGGVEAEFNFPLTSEVARVNTYDSSLDELSNTVMVKECQRLVDLLTLSTKGQVNVDAGKVLEKLSIANHRGTNLSTHSSFYYSYISVFYPASYAGVHKLLIGKKFQEMPDSSINYVIDLYNQSQEEVKPRGERMKVLFLPETMYVLIWRLKIGTSGKSVYDKETPIAEKIGEKIFDSKLTIYNDPLDDSLPGARSFDDEGVSGKYFPLVEAGVLKNFYYDLHYAKKLNTISTGHGFRGGMGFGVSEPITVKPNPGLNHLFIKPGDKTFQEMLKMMDKGIIVGGVLGAHSGNLSNGDFSVGLSPGIYVENGEIVGHVKDAMVAGNIYEVMKNVVAVENIYHPSTSMGTFPSILFEDVSVATKY